MSTRETTERKTQADRPLSDIYERAFRDIPYSRVFAGKDVSVRFEFNAMQPVSALQLEARVSTVMSQKYQYTSNIEIREEGKEIGSGLPPQGRLHLIQKTGVYDLEVAMDHLGKPLKVTLIRK